MKIKKFDSMNVIPFIDIMLVLLVIVLTTATFIAKGVIPISLPSAKSAKENNLKDSIKIFISQKDGIYLDKEKVELENLPTKLLSFKKDTLIKLYCDKELPYKDFVKVLDLLKSNNFENIAIVTQHE
ncbi:MAG: biopolymer transporter ExbD [Epsilonproteobacteria bacterium]|nr:biopolymer transporter ExbD [Campylobacterota bacterium]